MLSLALVFLNALITGVMNSLRNPGECSRVGKYMWIMLMISPLICEPS